MNAVEPKTRLSDIPNWHHHHSSKMTPGKILRSMVSRSVKIEGSAAILIIASRWPESGWTIEYQVNFSGDSFVTGKIILTEQQFEVAFGISNLYESYKNELSQWLLDSYGGEVACQGKFIRHKSFLNIPGPGTGHDGDPNISIFLSEEIRTTIKKLLPFLP